MENSAIPKKIHYIWFGNNPKSELIQRCIASWYRYFPDYEIIEWNESNYDINKCKYMKAAYENKKWAFASDYARFDILYEHGGIYLDTDVEFLRPLPELMLHHAAFTGYESSGYVNPGLIYAAVPGFSVTREILDAYCNMQFMHDGKPAYITVNSVVMKILEKHEILRKNEFQVVRGLALYPSSYFCGYDLDVGEYNICDETICVHHYAGTWINRSWKKSVRSILKKILGINAYRRVLLLKRRLKSWFMKH